MTRYKDFPKDIPVFAVNVDNTRQTDAAMTMQPDEADPNESFKRVTELRNVNDWAYQAQACCSNNLDVVRKLKESVDDETNELVSFETALAGYIESCEALLPRIRNTIDLVTPLKRRELRERKDNG